MAEAILTFKYGNKQKKAQLADDGSLGLGSLAVRLGLDPMSISAGDFPLEYNPSTGRCWDFATVLQSLRQGAGDELLGTSSEKPILLEGRPAGAPHPGQQQARIASWDVNEQADRVELLNHLYGQYVEDAKSRSSLPGDVTAEASAEAAEAAVNASGVEAAFALAAETVANAPAPAAATAGAAGAADVEDPTCQAPNVNRPETIDYIGQSWGHVERPEVVQGTAEAMVESFTIHCAVPSAIKYSLPIGAVYVNWRGGGKTTALGSAPFEALKLIRKQPENFAPAHKRLLQVTSFTRKHRLAYMIDFQEDTPPLKELADLTPESRVAWCLLYSMMRSSQTQSSPKRLQGMLARVREDVVGTGTKTVDGKVLNVELFKQNLLIGDVLTLMRRVHDIPQDQHIAVFWAWDEALAIDEELLQDMCDQFQSAALSPTCSKTWIFLTIASSVSRAMASSNRSGAPATASSHSKLRRYLLVPMYPLYVKDMLWLVQRAWRVIKPERGSWQLHGTVQYWVALVEGNPRLLECLLAAASGGKCWYQVNCQQLEDFLSKGVTDELAAEALLARLSELIKESNLLGSDALDAARSAAGSEWLLNLLGRCLLGTEVKGNDMMTGLQLSYSKGQDMGVFSLRVTAGGSGSSSSSGPLDWNINSLIDLQDPGCVHGTVHMPAIVVYLLYQQAISSGQFRHYQPLLKLWTGMLPSLLIHSRAREYINPGVVALKLDFCRVAQGRAVVRVGEVLPLQGAAENMFADYKVETDHDWTPIAAQHKDIKHEATNPAAPQLLIGQATAAGADSYLRLKLADEDGHIILWFRSKFHEAYGEGKEPADLQAEYDKAVLKDVPVSKQLFVLCTDAEAVSLEGLQANTVVICADQHAAVYSHAGVMVRDLVSQVVSSTERTRVDAAGDQALGPQATPALVEYYQKQMVGISRVELLKHARKHGIDDIAALGRYKAGQAAGIYEHRKRQRTQ